MNQHTTQLWETVYFWLRATGNKINRHYGEPEITAHWKGIVIYIEGGSNWENDLHMQYRQEDRNARLVGLTVSFTAIMLFILSAVHFLNIAINAFGLLSLIGLMISVALLSGEMGLPNRLVRHVCGPVGAGDCVQVLKTSYAKRLCGFTPADLSVLYFASQFILYLLGCWRPLLLQGNLLLSFLGIPVAFWSIFTQGVKVKQWCTLCLGIVSILLLQGLIAFFVHLPFQRIMPEVLFFVLFLFMAAMLLPVKQLLKTNKSNKVKLAELRKCKKDANLFFTLWEKEQEVDTTVWGNDVVIGEAADSLLITIASDPYCRPCAKAHQQIDNLLRRFEGRLKVQIRLFCNPNNDQDMHTIVVKDILANVAAKDSKPDIRQMLNDWFEYMEYDKWAKKWPHPRVRLDDADLEERLIQHSQWFVQGNVVGTPAIFINGKKLPGIYILEDLPVLIPRIEEYMSQKNTNNNK